MKKIVWITPDAFIDCDYNIEILNNILKHFQIHWIILLPIKQPRYTVSDFEKLKNIKNLKVTFIIQKFRARDFRMLLFFKKIHSTIKESKPDLVYFNFVPSSPYVLPLYWRLNKKKTIFTAHDGNVKSSFKIPWISKLTFKLAYRSAKYVNMFSQSQAKIFNDNFKDKKIFLIPLALKDYGKSKIQKKSEKIRFLFFGTIRFGKNIELLIKAGCELFEEGHKDFIISINGYCENWNNYAGSLTYPEIFELNINQIDNSEIPDLFSKSHFGIYPYNQLSQSGSLKVAFFYKIPVITSNLEGFKEEVFDRVNGYLFENENLLDLKMVIKHCLESHSRNYDDLCKTTAEFVEQRYSNSRISNLYVKMFDDLILNNGK